MRLSRAWSRLSGWSPVTGKLLPCCHLVTLNPNVLVNPRVSACCCRVQLTTRKYDRKDVNMKLEDLPPELREPKATSDGLGLAWVWSVFGRGFDGVLTPGFGKKR